MPLHALDAIDDALTATRRFRPRGVLEWVWVTIVAALVSSPGIGIPTGGSSGGEIPPEQRAAIEEVIPTTVPEWVAMAVAALIAVWLFFVLLGALLEFPFLRWLRDGEAAALQEMKVHWTQAVGLAVFRAVLSALGLAVLGALVVSATGPSPSPTEYLFVLPEYGIILSLVGIPTGLIAAFTTAFVVPTMMLENCGVLSGWRRVWSTLTDAPKQFLAYAVGAAILATIGGILVSIASVFGFLIGGILGGILGVGISAASAGVSGFLVAIAVGIVGAIIVGALVYAVVQLFLRYYALFVLGAIDSDLEFLPERRAAIGGTEAETAPSE